MITRSAPPRKRARRDRNGIGRRGPAARTLRRMAIEILDARAIAQASRRAGRAAAETLALVGVAASAPGSRTADIDAWVREDTARRGGTPSQLGYHGFPAAVCTSRNEVVCHGIPRRARCSSRATSSTSTSRRASTASTATRPRRSSSASRRRRGAARRRRRAALPRRGHRRRARRRAARRHRRGDPGARARARAAPWSRDFGGHGIGRAMHAGPARPARRHARHRHAPPRAAWLHHRADDQPRRRRGPHARATAGPWSPPTAACRRSSSTPSS